VDGDNVTVKTSKGTNAELAMAMSTSTIGIGSQLRRIDLSTTTDIFIREVA
jgi:hypothetical protein